MKKTVMIYLMIGFVVLFCGLSAKVNRVNEKDLYIKAAQTEVDVWDGTADTSWYDEVQVLKLLLYINMDINW